MRKSAQEQRLAELENEFQELLMECLKECSEKKRWGLFGQNRSAEAAKKLEWDEAARVKELALEIREIRAEWGDRNATVETFMAYCAEFGQNLPGEPKRAAKLLKELEAERR